MHLVSVRDVWMHLIWDGHGFWSHRLIVFSHKTPLLKLLITLIKIKISNGQVNYLFAMADKGILK